MRILTLQTYQQRQWHDAMELCFLAPEAGHGGACTLGYLDSYVLGQLDRLGSTTAAAVSATLPLSWDIRTVPHWPAFLLDIEPSGSARRFLLPRLALPAQDEAMADYVLLERCTPAPVGHLRVKESYESLGGQPIGFDLRDVVTRDTGFLEYAYEQGAAVGGATGAGGEAPKLLLAEDAGGLLYPDAILDDARTRRHWFVKFPRGQATPADRDILRSEYCYCLALQTLGIATAGGPGTRFEEADKPSLWMPRFDRSVDEHGVQRIAVESIYSLAGNTRPGSYMSHLDAVDTLARAWQAAGQDQQRPALLRAYLLRDLLNQILGNSDNHGRNLAVLRGEESLALAPIYDLAPMVMDPEGITRSTKWPEPIERAGEVDWRAACQALAPWGDPARLFEELREDAARLRALPDLLRELGLPEATMQHPRIALGRLDQRLRQWDLA